MPSILPKTDLVNPSNSHFTDPVPQFSSIVGPVVGCTGSVTSDLALRQKGLYSYKYMGGKYRKRSKKRSLKRKNRHTRRYRGGTSYGMKSSKPTTGQQLSPSSGYPDYNKNVSGEPVVNPLAMKAGKQAGGKRRKTKHYKKSKKHGKRSHKKQSRKKMSRKYRKRGGGMFKGYVAFTPSFSVDVKNRLPPKLSGLANPPPIKRQNDCLNTWKHLGSENKPYNKVWN